MALTKEDLRAIQALLQPLQDGQAATNARLDTMQAEIAEDFTKVHGDIGRLQEGYAKQFKLLNEHLPNAVARHEAVVELENKVENHDNRIFALEQKAANG